MDDPSLLRLSLVLGTCLLTRAFHVQTFKHHSTTDQNKLTKTRPTESPSGMIMIIHDQHPFQPAASPAVFSPHPGISRLSAFAPVPSGFPRSPAFTRALRAFFPSRWPSFFLVPWANGPSELTLEVRSPGIRSINEQCNNKNVYINIHMLDSNGGHVMCMYLFKISK